MSKNTVDMSTILFTSEGVNMLSDLEENISQP